MKLKILYIIGLAAVLGTGCKKSYLDINTNPNALPTATPAYVITNALNTTANNMLSPNEIGSYWSGQWTQSNGYILSTTTFAYSFTNGDFNYWDGMYDNLYDYQYTIDNADAAGQKFFKGPAKVMKAYIYQHLVDMYGNIPYSDALKGVGSLAPAFDDQKKVYEGLIGLLDSAIVDIKANAFSSAFAGSDIVFKGNSLSWQRFANSLKLRILVHQARIAGRDAYITGEINKIVTEGSGFITGSEVGVNPGYAANAGQLNPIYNNWGYSETGAKRALNNYPRLTEFFVNQLKATKDTFRLKRFGYAIGGEGTTAGVSAKAEIADNYIGIPFGVSSGFLPSAASALGPSLLVKGDLARPYVLMSAAEVQFLLAEAKQRYGVAITVVGTPQSFYEEGVKQAFRLVGSTTAQATALLTSGVANADWAASTNPLTAIATQKWTALANFNGFEAWTEYRRTGLPVTPQSPQVINADRPVRFFYPNTEFGSNSANVPAGINVFTSRVFWDID